MKSFIPWQAKRQEGDPGQPAPLAGLRHEIDKLFDAYVREPLEGVEWPFGSQGKWVPAVEVIDSDDAVVIRVELPGVDPEAIDVTATDTRLVISGEKCQAPRPERSTGCRCETRYGTFRRSVSLPEGADIENIDARYEHGILTLQVPKQPAAAPKVHIKVAG